MLAHLLQQHQHIGHYILVSHCIFVEIGLSDADIHGQRLHAQLLLYNRPECCLLNYWRTKNVLDFL